MEHLTEATFKEKVFDWEKHKDWKFKGELPAIIDFYADWCQPCKMVAPILEELAENYKGKLNIYKIDTEDQQKLAALFNIKSIPSLLFIPQEGKPKMAFGAQPKEAMEKMIEEELIN